MRYFYRISLHRATSDLQEGQACKVCVCVCGLYRCYKALKASGKLRLLLIHIDVAERFGAFGSEAVCILGCVRAFGSDEWDTFQELQRRWLGKH